MDVNRGSQMKQLSGVVQQLWKERAHAQLQVQRINAAFAALGGHRTNGASRKMLAAARRRISLTQKDRSGPKNAVGEGKERSVTEGIKRMIWAMARHIALPALKHGRGNPNWGKPPQWLPPLPTEFEALVKKAGLSTAQYVASTALRRWCDHNRSRCYVPEWLPEE